LGNSHDNFQLHRFTISENIAKSFRGATFSDSHCRAVIVIIQKLKRIVNYVKKQTMCTYAQLEGQLYKQGIDL